MKFVSVYKCRMCGQLHSNEFLYSDKDDDEALKEVAIETVIDISNMSVSHLDSDKCVRKGTYHTCSNGDVGFSDFQGWRFISDNDWIRLAQEYSDNESASR